METAFAGASSDEVRSTPFTTCMRNKRQDKPLEDMAPGFWDGTLLSVDRSPGCKRLSLLNYRSLQQADGATTRAGCTYELVVSPVCLSEVSAFRSQQLADGCRQTGYLSDLIDLGQFFSHRLFPFFLSQHLHFEFSDFCACLLSAVLDDLQPSWCYPANTSS